MSTAEPTAPGEPPTVGPVLESGPLADAIVAAIRALNRDVVVVERGAYIRVLVPLRCRVTRDEIQRHAARDFRLPSDLEAVMPSFKGRLSIDGEEVVWDARGEQAP